MSLHSPTPSEVIELLPYLTEAERAELDSLLTRREAPIWEPVPGPQTEGLKSQADILFYGGAAGSMKTDLLLGAALTAHSRSIIFRRSFKEMLYILERLRVIIGDQRLYSGRDEAWRLPDGRQIELGGCYGPGDEQKYKGRPHDLKAFDEICDFSEYQFRFLNAWKRTTDPQQRCRTICAGNPPTNVDGQWVITYFRPWLDRQHPNPAAPGELRWFAMIGGEEVEVGGPDAISHAGELIYPESRTFIPGRVDDNPYYATTGYKRTLQQLPEPLRSALLHGNFHAAQEDDAQQIVPTAWVEAAQARWGADGRVGAMTALGVDVARGGGSRTVLSPRYGTWFAEQQVSNLRDGPQVAAAVMTAVDGPDTPVQIDVIGVGTSPLDHLRPIHQVVIGLNGGEASSARDRSGRLGFVNKRAEWWWRMREALEPELGDGLALPPDRMLLADLVSARWRLTPRGIQVEAKEDIVKRLRRSPDRGDAAVYALAGVGSGWSSSSWAVGEPLASADHDWDL